MIVDGRHSEIPYFLKDGTGIATLAFTRGVNSSVCRIHHKNQFSCSNEQGSREGHVKKHLNSGIEREKRH